MSATKAGVVPAKADPFTNAINAADHLANDVGPFWGLIIIVAICFFMPRIGVLVHLASLFKEDRADARKQKVESERLLAKYQNRPKLAKPQPPKKKEG